MSKSNPVMRIDFHMHTRGSHDWTRVVCTGGQSAVINTGDMKLTMQAAEDGAELTLDITNRTDYAWPKIAGIIPCFNPGAPTDRAAQYPKAIINPEFDNQNTWFVGRSGLQRLLGRKIHSTPNSASRLTKRPYGCLRPHKPSETFVAFGKDELKAANQFFNDTDAVTAIRVECEHLLSPITTNC